MMEMELMVRRCEGHHGEGLMDGGAARDAAGQERQRATGEKGAGGSQGRRGGRKTASWTGGVDESKVWDRRLAAAGRRRAGRLRWPA